MPGVLAATLVLSMLVCAGCKKASLGESVSGTVTYKNNPLEGGSIAFFPIAGRPVIAEVAGDGSYEVQLPPGDYVVTIAASAKLPEGFKEGDPAPPPGLVLPAQYTTQAKSTLAATVAADQSEPIDFALQ